MEIIIKLNKIIVLGVFTDSLHHTNSILLQQCHQSQHHLRNPRHPQRRNKLCIKQNLQTNPSLLTRRPRQVSLLKICLPPPRISTVAALVIRMPLSSIRTLCTKANKIAIARTTLHQTSTTKTPLDNPTIIAREAEAPIKGPILPTQCEAEKNNTANMETTRKTQLSEPWHPKCCHKSPACLLTWRTFKTWTRASLRIFSCS
jgi:hypothetical protein